jgi:hypothetical protein
VLGRYFYKPRPTIRLYSLPAALCYRQPPHVKRIHLEQMAAMDFGMTLEQSGSRWVCRWTAEGIRRYTLEYVLAHEIGHHVYYLRHGYPKNRRAWEQFAHDYAMRRIRAR